MCFYSRKNRLNRVEFWAVAHVKYVFYIEAVPPLPQAFGLVDIELVHEQSDGLASVSLTEFLEEVKKRHLVDCLCVKLA